MSHHRLRGARRKAATIAEVLTIESVVADPRTTATAIEVARGLERNGDLDAFVSVLLLLDAPDMIESARMLGDVVAAPPDTVDQAIADFGARGITPMVLLVTPVDIAGQIARLYERDEDATYRAGRQEDISVFLASRGGFRLMVVGAHGVACLRGPIPPEGSAAPAPSSRAPRMHREGDTLLFNPAGLARLLYEMGEQELREMGAEKRPLVLAFQAKVRRQLLVHPNLNDAIATTVHLERVEQAWPARGMDALFDVLETIAAERAS